jgi:hypothetical protein
MLQFKTCPHHCGAAMQNARSDPIIYLIVSPVL